LVVTLGEARQSTPTIPKTLNPEWNVSFEMPVVGVPLLECICWDHDRFGKDYLGEFDIALEDIFEEGQISQEVKCYAPVEKQGGSNTVTDGHVAQMVHAQIESDVAAFESKEEEEGQQRLGRNSLAVLACRFRESRRVALGHISEIQKPGLYRRRGRSTGPGSGC